MSGLDPDVSVDTAASGDLKRTVRRAGIWVTLIFWGVQYVELTIANWFADAANATAYLIPRAFVVAVGIMLTLGLVEISLSRTSEESLGRSAGRAAVAVATASAAVGLANYAIYIGLMPVPGIHFDPVQFMYQFFSWTWFFATIAAAILAISYSLESRDRERRLAEMQVVAHSAQMRALRYQLNPHFLFNTLNSIASLIPGHSVEAERMVESLSDFLRTSLELDPFADISLEKELELQSLYLEIETLRFPERLAVVVDVTSEVKEALVPSLITQPLIENAIKYGVARSRSKVTLLITAKADGGSLVLTLSNSSVDAPAAQPVGMGLGIKNVEDRLRARFGENQSLVAGPTPAGDFQVVIRVPLRYSAPAELK